MFERRHFFLKNVANSRRQEIKRKDSLGPAAAAAAAAVAVAASNRWLVNWVTAQNTYDRSTDRQTAANPGLASFVSPRRTDGRIDRQNTCSAAAAAAAAAIICNCPDADGSYDVPA